MYETCLFYLRWKNLHSVRWSSHGITVRPSVGEHIYDISRESILPSIKKDVAHWKRYVDDTHAYINPSKIEFLFEKLNSYQPNIQFTHEIEENQKITFLDVLITPTRDKKLETTVFRKKTNTDLYINWNSHVPIHWKRGSLKNLIQRSILICSNEKLREDKLDYLRNVFIKENDYPPKLVNSMIKTELEKNSSDQQEVTTNSTSKQIRLVLPYAGKRGNNIIRKMRRQLNKRLKNDVKAMITYQGTKLSSRFQVKDQTKFEHRNDLVYCCKCPENDCDDFYIGEIDRQISERIIYHNKRDKNSHPLQHAENKKQEHVWINVFTILNGNYRSKIKRKISESLYMRSKNPTLNTKETSMKLNLFN